MKSRISIALFFILAAGVIPIFSEIFPLKWWASVTACAAGLSQLAPENRTSAVFTIVATIVFGVIVYSMWHESATIVSRIGFGCALFAIVLSKISVIAVRIRVSGDRLGDRGQLRN